MENDKNKSRVRLDRLILKRGVYKKRKNSHLLLRKSTPNDACIWIISSERHIARHDSNFRTSLFLQVSIIPSDEDD